MEVLEYYTAASEMWRFVWEEMRQMQQYSGCDGTPVGLRACCKKVYTLFRLHDSVKRNNDVCNATVDSCLILTVKIFIIDLEKQEW